MQITEHLATIIGTVDKLAVTAARVLLGVDSLVEFVMGIGDVHDPSPSSRQRGLAV
jgi:hypothetical protein